MRTIRLALGDATLECIDIGTMDARPKRTPRPGGQSAGPSGTGFCDRQPPARELVEFQGAATGRSKKPSEGGLLNNGSRSGDRDCRAGPCPAKPDVAEPREANTQHRPSRRLGNAAGNIDCVVCGTAQAVRANLIELGHRKRRRDANRGHAEKTSGPEVNVCVASRFAVPKTVFELSSNVLSVTDQPVVKKFTVRPLRAL
jgi:hypothetical protein